MTLKTRIAALVAAVALVACGGGGGSPPPEQAAAPVAAASAPTPDMTITNVAGVSTISPGQIGALVAQRSISCIQDQYGSCTKTARIFEVALTSAIGLETLSVRYNAVTVADWVTPNGDEGYSISSPGAWMIWAPGTVQILANVDPWANEGAEVMVDPKFTLSALDNAKIAFKGGGNTIRVATVVGQEPIVVVSSSGAQVQTMGFGPAGNYTILCPPRNFAGCTLYSQRLIAWGINSLAGYEVSLNSGEYVSRFGGWTDQSGNQTSYGDTRLALGPPGGYRMYAGQTMEISIAADVPLDGWLFAELDAAAGPDRVLVKAPRVCAALMRSTKGCRG